MTTNHRTIVCVGAVIFFAGTLYYSIRNAAAAGRMFPDMHIVPAALIVSALILLMALVLFSFLKEKNVLTYSLCFLPATSVWMSLSADSVWNWAAIILTAVAISISRLRWPSDARNSTLGWTGAGVLAVILSFCAAIAQGTL